MRVRAPTYPHRRLPTSTCGMQAKAERCTCATPDRRLLRCICLGTVAGSGEASGCTKPYSTFESLKVAIAEVVPYPCGPAFQAARRPHLLVQALGLHLEHCRKLGYKLLKLTGATGSPGGKMSRERLAGICGAAEKSQGPPATRFFFENR